MSVADGPVFIVGVPRSGTTLLRDLLRAHPRLSFPPESKVLPWWYEVRGDPRSDRQARRLAADLLGSSAISHWGLETTPSQLAHHRTFAGLAGALFEEWARRDGSPRWGDKTPHYVRNLPLLAGLWPDAQFVHLIRDGRDVACSWRDRGWTVTDAHDLGRIWARDVRAGRRDGAALGSARYLELRYERLVDETERALRTVCAFLEEDYTPALLAPERRGDPVLDEGREGYEEEVRSASVGRWRTALTVEDQALFAGAAGDLLEELGYPDVGPRRLPTPTGTRRRSIERRVRFVRYRLTVPERVPLARQTLLMWRARLARRLRPRGAARGGG